METVQEVKAQGYLRLNEERKQSRKLRRLLYFGLAIWALTVIIRYAVLIYG